MAEEILRFLQPVAKLASARELKPECFATERRNERSVPVPRGRSWPGVLIG